MGDLILQLLMHDVTLSFFKPVMQETLGHSAGGLPAASSSVSNTSQKTKAHILNPMFMLQHEKQNCEQSKEGVL